MVLMMGVAGCLDFDPGTPNNMPAPDDGGVKPQQPVDMAHSQQQTAQDMAQKPGADLANAPPAPLGMELCEVTLSLSGTYTQGTAPAADFPGGCWPDGTWSFSATVTQNGCATTPPIEATYQFKVVEDQDFNDTITYLNDPSNMYLTTKISGGEGGVCTGAFKIFSGDCKTIYNLRPAMQADNSINGQGDIRVYDVDQRF